MNTNVEPEIIQRQALQLADPAYETAQQLSTTIDSQEMYTIAADELRAVTTKRKQIEDMRLTITRPMDEAKRKVMDLFRTPLERLDDAERLIKQGMLTFQQAEQRKAEEARRAAEQQARAEREEAARRQRDAEEAQRKAHEAMEAARKAGDAAAAEAAAKAEEEAHAAAEDAEAQVMLADVAPPASIAVVAPKAVGISTRQNWKAEVTDLGALVKAAAAQLANGDTTLLGYLLPNEKAIGQVARALKTQARIPGVRIYAEDGLAVRVA